MPRILQAVTTVLAALAVLFVLVGPSEALWTRAAAWVGLAALGVGMIAAGSTVRSPTRSQG